MELGIGLIVGMVLATLGLALMQRGRQAERAANTVREYQRGKAEGEAQAAALQAKLDGLSERRGELQTELQQERDEHQALQQTKSELERRLSAWQAAEEERGRQHKSQLEQLDGRFKTLAGEVLEEKRKRITEDSKKIAEDSNKDLKALLNPLREQFQRFEKQVKDAYDKEGRERHSLTRELEQLVRLNKQLSQDAVNLTHALQGDSQAQGAWGEVVLERLLEM